MEGTVMLFRLPKAMKEQVQESATRANCSNASEYIRYLLRQDAEGVNSLKEHLSQSKDTSYSSLWLYEKKRVRGYVDELANKTKNTRGTNFSEFNPIVAGKIIRFWSDVGDTIFDPFAGRTRASIALLEGRNYIGFEISPIVINSLNKTSPPMGKVRLINDDSYNLDNYNLSQVDMVFTCPPYWDLEKYESLPGQLSDIKDYNEFLGRLGAILEKSSRLLKKDGFFVVVVGDWRKDNTFYSFHSDMIKLMETIGLELWDTIALQSVPFFLACNRFGSCRPKKFTAKSHEYILIFKK